MFFKATTQCQLIVVNTRAQDTSILPQNALRHDCNGKSIELMGGHYLEVVVEVY